MMMVSNIYIIMSNFSITNDSELAKYNNRLQELTPKKRYENNIAAIKLIKRLENESTLELTEDEQLTLATFAGWGAIAEVFDVRGHDSGWKLEAQRELKQLLSEREYSLASESILNAHYTEPSIASVIWESLCKLGFTGGDILEPACGNGLFFATCPQSIRENSNLYGVELDPYPAKISQQLHRDATIYNCGFAVAPFDNESLDLVISNVPFGNYKVEDVKYNHLQLSIHNYFLAKASDLIRPGGYIAVITSTSFLDAKNETFRSWLGERLHLCAAVRLPNDAFKTVANTEVTTDILFFRKISGNFFTRKNINEWLSVHEIELRNQQWGIDEPSSDYWSGWKTDINYYFLTELDKRKADRDALNRYEKLLKENHPHLAIHWKNAIYNKPHKLLGNPCVNKLYGRGFALSNDGRNLINDIRRVIDSVSDNYKSVVIEKLPISTNNELIKIPQELLDTKDYSFVIWDNSVYQRKGNYLVPSKLSIGLLNDFIGLKSVIDNLIRYQSLPEDNELVTAQEIAKLTLDKFESKHGSINSKKLTNELGEDYRFYILRTLYKKDGTLADIFSKRVCRVYQVPAKVTEASDAMIHCLNEKGKFDLDFIVSIMHLDKSEVIERLRGDDLIYFDPSLDIWVSKEEYLSGNVYAKLQKAIELDLVDNINALKLVQPLPMLPATDNEDIKIACLRSLNIDFDSLSDDERIRLLSKSISVKLGTNWIPSEIYRKFASEVMKISATINYLGSPISSWVVEGSYYSSDTTEFGTDKLDSSQILEKGLNQQDPKVVVYHHDGEFDRDRSAEYTEAARGKLDLIKSAFKNWIWEDCDRAIELCKYYNENINVYAERKFDGSYLKLPGSNPEIKLRPWQLNGVSRILENSATFLAHEVGLGKTLTMVTAVMEARRLGLAKKCLLVALNGTERQIADAFEKMYPMSRVLVPAKLDAEGRKLFTASIATSDYDCVIITQSQFFTLAMSSEYQISFLNQEKLALEEILAENKDKRGLTKSIKKSLKNVESRISKVTNSVRKDSHIDFEQLGIDMLLIDEIHMAKNLGIITKIQNVRGIPTTHSQRALDTYMKLLYVCGDLVERGIVGKIVGSTGTIVSNTMAEIFNWQRMFQRKLLIEKGLDTFDAWVSQFGEQVSSSEISPSGEYRVITRFKSFQNLQVLCSTMGQFVDIATVEQVGNDILKRPEAKYIDINVEPSEQQLEFLRTALKRSEAIRNRQVEPTEDNMLKVTSDLTKAALSMRLLRDTKESHNSKLHECAFNVWKIWEATKQLKGVQAIFCDFSTPKKDEYSVYEYIKLVLLALGVPDSEIEFIHDHDNKKRAKLFDRVNCGNVRVIFGSTGKLGTGCNLHQQGLWALHHVDAPWRPSDIEQREGRAIRQGNGENLDKQLTSVLVFRYITERLDALRWQTLQWKQEMINKFLNGANVDSIDDCDQVVYSFAQVKSLATGNPLLIEESNLRNELNSLLVQQREHQRQQLSLGYKIQSTTNRIKLLSEDIDKVTRDIENNPIPHLWGTVETLQENAIATLTKMKSEGYDNTCELLTHREFTLVAKWVKISKAFTMTLHGNSIYSLPFNMGNGFVLKPVIKDLCGTIDKFIELLPDYLEVIKSKVIASENELERFVSLRGKPFPNQARIVAVQSRLSVIDAELSETNEGLGISADDDKESIDELWIDSDTHIHIDGWRYIDKSLIESLRTRPEPDWINSISV
jgi:N12 class adenine-specific DNA methylase